MAISKNEFALKNIQEKLQYLFENGGESGGGGGAVKVDNFISSSSENPVQNKVLFSDLIFKGTKEEYNIHKNNLLNNHIVILTNKDDKGTYLYTGGSLLKIADVTTITDDLKTVDTGTALDARQGKKLLDSIDIIKNNLGGFSFKVKNGTYGYEYKSIFTPFGAEISPDQSNILSFKDGLYVPKPTDKVDINQGPEFAGKILGINSNGKVIPVDNQSGEIPIATKNVAGIVKPDGKTITVTEEGVISAVGGSGGDIQLDPSPKNIIKKTDEGLLLATITDDSITEIKFGMDANGNYGYYKAGADTLTPFKSGGLSLLAGQIEYIYEMKNVSKGISGTYEIIE